MLSANGGGGRGVVGGCVAATSMKDWVHWEVLGRKSRDSINLSRLRAPVSFGAITGQIEMGVQSKGCRLQCADPRGLKIKRFALPKHCRLHTEI